MSRAENRHYTSVWKKRRKTHLADKCKKAKCSICSWHKTLGNNKGFAKKKWVVDKIGAVAEI